MNWLLGAYVIFSSIGAIVGAFAFEVAGVPAALPAFMVPSIAGVIVISRALKEGQLTEREASRENAK